MKLTSFFALLTLGLTACGASAAAHTFDGVDDIDGDGQALLSSMNYNGPGLLYQEAGFLVTLSASNADAGAAHVGDGINAPSTFSLRSGSDIHPDNAAVSTGAELPLPRPLALLLGGPGRGVLYSY